MAQCPNCGAAVADGAPVCDSCGLSFGENVGQQGQGGHKQGGQGQQGQPQGGQPRQGQPQQGHGQDRQPQGQPQRQPQGQPQQGYQQGGQQRQPQGGYQQGGYGRTDDDVVAGLTRRQLLGIGGGAAVAAVGGFLLLGGGPSGPAGTAEAFMQALVDGNGQAAADLLHPDAQVSESQASTWASQISQFDVSVDGAEVVQESDGRATVEVTVSAQGQSQAETIEVRQANGEWQVYAVQGF